MAKQPNPAANHFEKLPPETLQAIGSLGAGVMIASTNRDLLAELKKQTALLKRIANGLDHRRVKRLPARAKKR